MHNLEYNTSKKKLVLPEYGRNIQKMVEHAIAIKDRETRNEAVRAIIAIMGNMNPHLRDVSDFKHKLWDHIAIMSEFSADIDSPYPTPMKETFLEPPLIVPINKNDMRYRYYGKIIESLIRKVSQIQDPEKRASFIPVITNHMKKSYLTWNKEIVNDEIIFEHLRELSKGRLVVDNDLRLTDSREIVRNKKRHITPMNEKRN